MGSIPIARSVVSPILHCCILTICQVHSFVKGGEKRAMMRRSHIRFANPSFFTGLARVLDLSAGLKLWEIGTAAPQEADFLALQDDWYTIGDDLRNAIAAYHPPLTTQTT